MVPHCPSVISWREERLFEDTLKPVQPILTCTMPNLQVQTYLSHGKITFILDEGYGKSERDRADGNFELPGKHPSM